MPLSKEAQLVAKAINTPNEKRTPKDFIVIRLNAMRIRGELTMYERDLAIRAALDIFPGESKPAPGVSLDSVMDAVLLLARLREKFDAK